MRVMIDTNVLIYREDDAVVSEDIQELLSKLTRIEADILVHPLTQKDIGNDKNKERREIVISKMKTYHVLDKPPRLDQEDEYWKKVPKPNRENDEVDDQILYAVFKDAVDFLITEDREIHRKARLLGIDDRVLLITDAILIANQYLPKSSLMPPISIKEEFVYNLDTSDPIFNSLREEYQPEFDSWLLKIKREGRQCLVYHREDGSIGALLIYKIEDEAIHSTPPLPKKKRLKLATFKVKHVGYKLGELLIKLSVDLAKRHEVDEMYLTHFREQRPDRLIELITDYGFLCVANNTRGENIFVKKLVVDTSDIADVSPLEIARIYYPSIYDGPRVGKYLIPIRPEFHDRLFTDFLGRQSTLLEYAGDFIIEGNTIKKAYICHSPVTKMNPGDIIIFYVSVRKHLSGVGVVEEILSRIKDPEEIIKRVGKRTVYSKQEIETMSQKPTTVILFRHHFHVLNLIKLNQLKQIGVLSAAPQSITRINDENYGLIKTVGGIDVRYTFDQT